MSSEKNTERALESDSPKDLQGWINKLNGQEMPIFAHTAMEIAAVAERGASNSAEMARVILQDAAMTSRILKMANSAYYSVGRVSFRSNINTITRAVILLGFDTVRSLCEAKAVVEALLRGYQRERLIKGMAESFHAAVQARALAISQKDRSPEEVFIATLLYHLGEMAFWSFADEKLAQKMESAMAKPEYSKERAEKEVLGFRLQQLTDILSKQWRLGELLQEALANDSGSSSRVKNGLLGHRLAQSVDNG
jgi:HD-like signal output (HDOD) protein